MIIHRLLREWWQAFMAERRAQALEAEQFQSDCQDDARLCLATMTAFPPIREDGEISNVDH